VLDLYRELKFKENIKVIKNERFLHIAPTEIKRSTEIKRPTAPRLSEIDKPPSYLKVINCNVFITQERGKRSGSDAPPRYQDVVRKISSKRLSRVITLIVFKVYFLEFLTQ